MGLSPHAKPCETLPLSTSSSQVLFIYIVFCLHMFLHTRSHYRWLGATLWSVGIELRTFEPVLLTSESFL